MRQGFSKMVNRWSLVMVAVVMLAIVWTIPSKAATEGVLTYIVSNGEATITACDTSISGELVIPDTLGGYPVGSIGTSAFYGCSSLTRVVIPKGVKSIGEEAFRGCSSLMSIVIPEGLVSIGENAFNGCSKLSSIDIPKEVTSIGTNAFNGCTGLNSVNTTDIRAWCEIEFGDIISNPCLYSNNLCLNGEQITELVIPEGVISIGACAFVGCSRLTSVIIPEEVTFVGKHAFSGCSGVKEVPIKSLEAWCGIEFESATSNPCFFSKNLCLNGEHITELVIPEGITSIGSYAFSGCSSLTSVVIPKEITNIGKGAFYSCSSLTSMTLPITSHDNYLGYIFGSSGYSDNTSYVPSTLQRIEIQSGSTKIGTLAFYGCTGLTSVLIPNGVTSIGRSAFERCCGLTSVVIPEGVISIDEDAFFECSGLKSVVIPEGVKSIGDGAFYDCYNLTSINIPTSVTSIGSSAFSMCSSITSIVIPEGITSIEGSAFSSCSGLTSITIPSNVTSIGDSAFAYCKGLTSIVIPSSVKSIGNYAFERCTNLTSLTIPEEVTSIGDRVFGYCSSLTSVDIPSSVTSIDRWAFIECTSLTSLTIPSGVASMGSGVFDGCDNLILTVNNTYVRNYAINNNVPYVLGTVGISIKELPNKVEYCVGEDFVDDGFTITVHYYDGTSEEITSGYTVTGFDSSKAGSCTITIEYLGETTSFEVTILGEETGESTLAISSAALQLENDISVVFKAKAENIDGIYTEVYVIVEQELESGQTKKETIKGVLSENGLYYEFKYFGLNAKEVGDWMDVTIYGYRNGSPVTGKTLENYSVMTYCLNQLGKTASDLEMTDTRITAFKTLLVDLINYASEAQLYFSYKTNALVSTQLSEEQKAYASADSVVEDMTSVTNAKQEMIDNPTVTWNAASLLLKAQTTLRLKVTYAGNVENVKLYAKVGSAKLFEVTEYEEIGEGVYYFYFDKINAQEFCKTIDFYFVEGNAIISNTLRYSVESYASKKIEDDSIGGVVSSLIKYGKSALAYMNSI